ncbi:MAG: hypothetical protein ACYCY8_10545 [Burkholderiales bacterium]
MEKKPEKENRKCIEAEARAKRRPLQLKIAKLEEEMERLGAEKSAIDESIADPGFYQDREAVKAALLKVAEIGSKLSEVENNWLELQSELEALE